MFVNHYRKRLSPQESEAIRQLRRRGYAVIVMSPDEAGGPLKRKPVEDAMLKAGKKEART
jgi:hypothetical protein